MGIDTRADQTALIGRSFCGKSHWIKETLEAERPARLLVWSPLEATDNYARWGRLIDGDIGRLVAELSKVRGDAFSIVFKPERYDEKKLLRDFDIFCGLALALGKRAPIRLIVEELSLVTRPGWSPMRWRLVSTEGRHAGVSSIGTTQRPALIDKTYLSGSTMIRCGALSAKSDKVAMADHLDCTQDDIRALSPGEFLVWDIWRRSLVKEGQPIPERGERGGKNLGSAGAARAAGAGARSPRRDSKSSGGAAAKTRRKVPALGAGSK